MGRRSGAVAVVSALTALLIPAAEAKVGASLAFAPAPPVARSVVRATMRTDTVLSMTEGMTLTAVGPWRNEAGQAVRIVRLLRSGPRSYTASVRFPYAGRWRVQVMSDSGALLVGRQVWVRPHRRVGSGR
jgi:hypothetical protein